MPDGPGGFAQDYSCPALLRIPLGLVSIHIRNCHPLWLNFPDHSILDSSTTARSYYPERALLHIRFGLFPGRSPLLGESLLFSLPGGTKMFQFPPFASLNIIEIITLQVIGLSHSDIPGSQIICIYTGLFAAYHVLHRLREPRHPPCALTYFRQTVTNQHCQLSIVNYQFITSSYLQLLISFLYLQSCLCQYVKELSSVSNYR